MASVNMHELNVIWNDRSAYAFDYFRRDSVQPLQFLPRCMECRRGLAMRILSVRPSVCQTRDL